MQGTTTWCALAGARSLYETVLAGDPANADVMFRLGVLGLQCAAYDDALEAAEEEKEKPELSEKEKAKAAKRAAKEEKKAAKEAAVAALRSMPTPGGGADPAAHNEGAIPSIPFEAHLLMPLTSQIRELIPPTGSSRRKPKGHILGLDFCLKPYPIEPGMTYSWPCPACVQFV